MNVGAQEEAGLGSPTVPWLGMLPHTPCSLDSILIATVFSR